MNLASVLDQVETYLQENRTTIPEVVQRYLVKVIREDRQCIELIASMKQPE